MCGRFVRISTASDLASIFSALNSAPALAANYNVSPTTAIFALRKSNDNRELTSMNWGLVPVWAKDAKRASSLINARSETVAEKPSFRHLISSQRCVIPMDGYFEWATAIRHDEMAKVKQPYYFTVNRAQRYSHHGVAAVAGLWSSWHDPQADRNQPKKTTCVLLTRQANEMVGAIHDRMPVLLDDKGIENWLDPANSDPLSIVHEIPNDALLVHAVSKAVNNSRSSGSGLIEPVDLESSDAPVQCNLFDV